MRSRASGFRAAIGLCAVFSMLFMSGAVAADEAPLTRERVAALSRTAPSARVSRAEAAAVAAALTASGVLSLDNPVLTGLGGLRLNPDGTKHAAATATLSWPVDVFGQRGARI